MPEFGVYTIGQRVLLEGYNVDSAGDPASPTDPLILLKPPTGAAESLSITESPTGHFYHVLTTRTRAAGVYHYRILTADDAVERHFTIRASAFAEPNGP